MTTLKAIISPRSKKIVICGLVILLTVYHLDKGPPSGVHAITDVNITATTTNLSAVEDPVKTLSGTLDSTNVSATAANDTNTTSTTTIKAIPASAPTSNEPPTPTGDIPPEKEKDPEKSVTTSTTTTTTSSPVSNTTEKSADLPDKGAVEREHNSSMSIFFVLCVIACGILLIHLMLQTGFQYLPESIVVVVLGALIGMFINVLSEGNIANWKREEVFSPTAFFLVLLPPIIFESGYNLHKGTSLRLSFTSSLINQSLFSSRKLLPEHRLHPRLCDHRHNHQRFRHRRRHLHSRLGRCRLPPELRRIICLWVAHFRRGSRRNRCHFPCT